MKKLSTFLVLLLCLVNIGFLSKLYGQAVALPYTQNFSTANDLTLINGSAVNKWAYGSAVGNPANSLYISNDNGVTNGYTIAGASSIVHAYKEVIIPAGSTIATLAFDWKANGESTWDYLRVWLVPDTYTPTAGTAITAAAGRIQVGGNYNQQGGWQNYLNTNLNISTFAAAGKMRLVFEWTNDGSGGTQPPVAIDNINLFIPTCFVPTPLAPSSVATTTAIISWTAPTPAPANGYAYYLSTSNVPPTAGTIPTGTTAAGVTTINLTPLTPNTTYYWWIRSVCSATDNSIWATGTSFTTGQIATTLPYTQNFNTSNDLGFTSVGQTNRWTYGSATGNTGNSVYISNNNGTANAYTIAGATSIVHAYRDITVPAGTTLSTFTFDWKGDGEGATDLLRVWLVPASYMPVAGTGITAGAGRVQVGGNFNQQTTWQNYLNTNVNLSSFVGTMRLVFEWRNDGSGGNQPPIAIDNINLYIPTCFVPTAMGIGTVGSSTASINWTAPTPAPGNGYAYYVTTSNVPPVAGTLPTGTTAAGVTTANLTLLTPNTTYYWWVRSVCSPTDNSLWVAGPSFTTGQIPAPLPYFQDFNTTNDLGFTSAGQTNKWAYGSATGNAGKSVYISNDNGVSNAYTISGAISTVHAYRDITVPAGTTISTFTFDWKGVGESTWDYLRVWLVPTSYMPAAGTGITAGAGRIQVGGNFNQQTTWQNYLNTNLVLSSFVASGTVRLVFEWINDGSGGTQPPIAIDNINLFIPTCFVPTAMNVPSVGATTATIGWTPPTQVPGNGYQYYLSTSSTPPTAGTPATGASATNTAVLTPLTPNTTYYWWVRSVCSTTDRSIWVAGPSFTTTQIPATIPYLQDFTGANDFGFTSVGQVNKWVQGTATGNPGKSIYISNDNGVTNAYTISGASSIVHAYRDIAVPTGTTTAGFSFDWKAVGESTWDYLRVWLVPATYMPVAGAQITAGAGRIQLGANYNQQATWQSYSNATLNISSFAGPTPMRIVFEWTNDGSGGTQPPVAIDNIVLRICSNVTPVVTVIPTSITYNTTTITWPQDIGGATYQIRYRPVGSTTGWLTANVGAVTTPTNTYNLTNLLAATLYEVEVAAVCNSTPGGFSHNQFTTKCDPTPPNVTISNITTTSALITWNPLALSSSYTLRWRKVGTTGWPNAEIPLPLAPANTYTLQNLDVYTSYEVQIANKCDGPGNVLNPWSSSKVFTTDRTCNLAPPGLTITQLNPTSAVVVWDPFPGATYILKYRKVGIPGWTTVAVSTNTITLTGLLELTKYEMMVANVCTGTPGTFTVPYLFTTPTVTHCPMASVSAANEFISKVTVKPNGKPTMDNPSLASTYTDYTGNPAKFIELIQGSTGNEIAIEKSWLGANNNEGIAVWIDFDRNGTFDINERILASAPSTTTPIKGTFSVPTDAFVSLTDYKYVVMRVAMQRDGIPVNCTGFANGEVEDYTVRISKTAVPNAINQDDIMIFPNPVSTVLNVKNISTRSKYKIYNAAGQIVSSGIILNNKINVSQLINGIYVIDIEDIKGTAQKKFIKE
ncbi:fibronectin type III domain-containing protein [Chryseobacterium polytrichastri]|uniref:Por secretion system C-terminal sorting domain-containing protein n=1 Tax=Chryseobacterium polytrichastri TaxID=1302687 RepID=A0A1M6QYT6_9FLAO|nr:fibronectin type III domain-containing protein [Chryseobacterium polytrichastri]SHK25429.1 Por secretion system C-terminal sorting domain-containing protein [Chryseobacterium polytrichastri]